MKQKLKSTIAGIVLCLMFAMASVVTKDLKEDPAIELVAIGFFIAFATGLTFYIPKKSLKIPFYALLGLATLIDLFIILAYFFKFIDPNDGWITLDDGSRRRIMGMDWIWEMLISLVVAVLVLFAYKKLKINKRAEIIACLLFAFGSLVCLLWPR